MWNRNPVVYLTTVRLCCTEGSQHRPLISPRIRRFHRRVEEAIAAGVLLPSQTGDIGMGPGGSINVYRRNIGEKPKMWEAWIDERAVGHHPSLTSDWTKVQVLFFHFAL